jgi:hypothetical protein
MTDKESISEPSTQPPARGAALICVLIELLALAVLLCLAWKARSAWPRVLISDSDTWGYLSPALSWLSGHEFRQVDGRDWLYPAMLAFFLKTTGSFHGIFIWQRVLGYVSGIFMALTWRGWVSLLPVNRWIRLAVSLLGVLPISLQLINQQNILFEQFLRPEAVLACAVYAQLACVMAYCQFRWKTPKALPALIFGAGSLVLAYAALVLKPSWSLAFVTTSLPVFAGIFGRALPLKVRLLTPVVGGLLAWLLLWLPPKIWMKPDGASRTLLPDALFCVHVQFIDRLFHERLAKMADSDPEKARLQKLLDVMASETRNAINDPHAYEILGLNADYLMHSQPFTAAINDYANADNPDAPVPAKREKFRSFCFASYEAAVLRYPGDYTKKIWVQFDRHFLRPDPRSFIRDNIDLKQFYRDGVEGFKPEWSKPLISPWSEMYLGYLEDLAVQAKAARTLERQPKLRNVRKYYASLALLLEVLFIVALVVAHVWAPLRDLRIFGWAAFFLFMAPFGNAFGVCIVHTLDIFRYRATLGGYLLFALTAMAMFVLCAMVQAVVRLTPKPGKSAQ